MLQDKGSARVRLANMHNLWDPYNSNSPEPSFAKLVCESSLDIKFSKNSSSFPHTGRQKMAESEFLLKKWMFWAPKILEGTNFHGGITINE